MLLFMAMVVTTLGPRKSMAESVASYDVDTSKWLGAEYTPARATNQLWWFDFDNYIPDLHRELAATKKHLGFTVLRMFLHSMLWEHDSAALLRNVTAFLDIAAEYNISAGLVFFDDCWAHKGANLSLPCVVSVSGESGCQVGSFGQKRCCMNCWVASPQDNARTSIDRYRPYVTGVVGHFSSHPRVRFFEIFNEPVRCIPQLISSRRCIPQFMPSIHNCVHVVMCCISGWGNGRSVSMLSQNK